MSTVHSTGPGRLRLAVIGAGECNALTATMARGVGAEIARAQAILLCGGGTGVMAAAAAGAASGGALTLGILPGTDAISSPPNDSIQIPLYTGMGQARNLILVLSADAVIAVGGEWGTLSEIGLAMKHGRPVVLLNSWGLDPPGRSEPTMPYRAKTPAEAVSTAIRLIATGGQIRP